MLIKNPPQVLQSAEDLSVNFVWSLGDGNAIEARFVRREDNYFIVYLSSHTGCNQACRFCHLTATKQVSMEPVTLDDYLVQADTVLAYYDKVVREGRQVAARKVHFNWMARGEPFMNPVMLNNHKKLFDALTFRAKTRKLTAEFKLSSIFPKETPLDKLANVMHYPGVRTYYSLYSLDTQFRKRWIPKSHDPIEVLDWLAYYQSVRKQPFDMALHWAFIKNENDKPEQIEAITNAVKERGLIMKFNLVRYNPYSAAQGEESDEDVLQTRFEEIKEVCNTVGTRIVPRVGFDVRASCGMFVHPDEQQAA